MAAMADRFLGEVERMHQLRRDINEMTPEEADELIRGLGDDAAEDWVFAARDAQLPPPDHDRRRFPLPISKLIVSQRYEGGCTSSGAITTDLNARGIAAPNG